VAAARRAETALKESVKGKTVRDLVEEQEEREEREK
jgi:hypothetical protein